MSLAGVYGAADDAESEALIRHALDRGANHLDISDMYGWGHSETVVGRAIKGRRDEVMLATKFGQTQNPGGPNGVNGRPDYVMQACEASLQRLGVEVIDLYYQHRVDPAVPVEETVGAMAKLVQQGKVRFLGLSEARPDRIRRAHAVHPITAVQTEYSPLYRQEAEETRQTTRELGISFVAYSPLGRGFLTGAIQTLADVDGRRGRIRASRRRISRPIASSWRMSRRWPRRKAARPHRSRWPGCWRRAMTWSPSPARAIRRGSTKISARST